MEAKQPGSYDGRDEEDRIELHRYQSGTVDSDCSERYRYGSGAGRCPPWLRTSVIGSANNELISATMAASATGVEFTTTDMTPQAWINAAWAMTLGCSVALPIVLVVLKPVCKTYDVFRKKDSRWISIFSLCALVTVIAAFSINSGKKGIIPSAVIIGCFIFSYLCNLAAKNPKLKWLKDYAFPLTILFGLVLSMIITPFLS